MAGSGAGVEGLVLRGWDCMCHFEQRRESESRNLDVRHGLAARSLHALLGRDDRGGLGEMTKDHSERSIAFVIATKACPLVISSEARSAQSRNLNVNQVTNADVRFRTIIKKAGITKAHHLPRRTPHLRSPHTDLRS